MTMRLLVSVRSLGEARIALRGGADFIDLKEPARGALGALPLETVRAVVLALRAEGCATPLSATIGEPADVLAAVQAVYGCGVDIVKVGIPRDGAALLDALACCARTVLPVFIADRGFDDALVARALALPFAGVMLDTADKRGGSLLTLLSEPLLARFVSRARGNGTLVGLAGALRLDDLPALRRLKPDFAGFRSALCAGARDGALDAQRLQTLRRALHDSPSPPPSPARRERVGVRDQAS